jgi:hypothetical protein
MTYPPQQPGQYGPQQPAGQFGQSSYQGLGSYSGGGDGGGNGGPPKKRTGMIVAIVAIVVMVLGGGGTAVYFLTRGDDKSDNNASTDRTNGSSEENTPSDDQSSDSASPDRDPSSDSDDGNASNTPDDVRDEYMAAYENKYFSDVVASACEAYKDKFGTDTSSLETELADYDITAEPNGDAEVSGSTATAKIDLTLSSGEETKEPKILIKIVEEGGQWRFCGEGKA